MMLLSLQQWQYWKLTAHMCPQSHTITYNFSWEWPYVKFNTDKALSRCVGYKCNKTILSIRVIASVFHVYSNLELTDNNASSDTINVSNWTDVLCRWLACCLLLPLPLPCAWLNWIFCVARTLLLRSCIARLRSMLRVTCVCIVR